MSEQRYVLTVQYEQVFKEVDISADTPHIRIGTLQDCDVRLKRDLFSIPICVTIQHGADGWFATCEDGLSSSMDANDRYRINLRHGDIISLYCEADKEKKSPLILSFSYDFTVSAIDFDTIIDIRDVEKLLIGNSAISQIKLSSNFIESKYLTLMRNQDGTFSLDAGFAPGFATVNGVRIHEQTIVQECDFIGLADFCFYYKNQELYTKMRDDLHIVDIPTRPLNEHTPAFTYPMLNRSPRMLYAFNTEPIEVLNPPNKPEKPRENMVLQFAPALMMIAVVVVTRSGIISGLSMGNMSFMIMSLSMMTVGIFTSVLSLFYSKKRYKKDLAEWKSDYTAYISEKRQEIELEHKSELSALVDSYPDADCVSDIIRTFSGRVFERSPKDADFLDVRIGLGSVPSLRKPTFRHTESIKVENELACLPEQLCSEYFDIKDAPVMLRLREYGIVGVVGSPNDQYEFFKNTMLDICVLHDYEEVQAIVLIPQSECVKYDWIKWIPHIKESGGGVRGIVCDDESRDNLYEYLYALMTERSAMQNSQSKNMPLPHIVVFVLEEYGMKTHPLFKFSENSAELGLSFVYFKQFAENLPQHCSKIVDLVPDGGILRLRNDKAFTSHFIREQVKDDSIRLVAERLAPVFCEKIALSSRLTASITLFELLNIISPEDLNLHDRWSKSNVQKSLAAPLGVDAKGSHISLDLHEKAHGPHGLVAGTTGSGKSEIMQSYILSAAVNFHPYEVAFVIIDFKGGGMANQFEELPHLVGKITDIDNHEINRSLQSIRAELEKRKRLFAEYEVNHIDNYIEKYRSGATDMPLPHLILIVDEFAELKAEQPEFMKELISTARVGRSLGIHLILATQKPAGQVNEQIWSNSRFKLCLKVANKEDSNEVIKSPLASEIREPGRVYLQVGNNEIFTLFQSAYSGASAISDKYGNIREFSISQVSFTGRRSVIYERKAERSSDGKKITQLQSMVDYINGYCKQHYIAKLPNICLPPLPEKALYKSAAKFASGNTVVSVGIYDDPSNQVQPEVQLDLSSNNAVIVGSAQTGKTMLLQTILRGIAERYTPKQVSVYILDFASKVLKIYENLNHVGGVLTDSDEDMLRNFFKMIQETIEARKECFSHLGISSYGTYLEIESSAISDLPHIVIILDNLSVFKEVFQEYEEAMLHICREGLAMGISVIATAKQTAGLSYKYLSNFQTRIAFNCTESSEYSNIFDKCRIQPRNLQGRGLVEIDKTIYEFQAFLPFDDEKESQRIEQTKAFITDISKKYEADCARKVPSIPPILTDSYFKSGSYRFKRYVVPVGLTYGKIEPATIDLIRIGTVGIYGREAFGKSNLLRIIFSYLHQNVFDLPCKAYLIDDYDRQLAEFENSGFVERYTIDCADFEEIISMFSDVASTRMDTLRTGGNLDSEPLLLCVVQNSQIFAANSIAKTTSDQFKKLIGESKQLKICFVFSNVENNPEYSPSEIMKIAREFSQYILLDDIANVKLFGTSKFSANDLRAFKKPISVGDGYSYDARNGIERIKFIKCEGSV